MNEDECHPIDDDRSPVCSDVEADDIEIDYISDFVNNYFDNDFWKIFAKEASKENDVPSVDKGNNVVTGNIVVDKGKGVAVDNVVVDKGNSLDLVPTGFNFHDDKNDSTLDSNDDSGAVESEVDSTIYQKW